MLNSLIKIQVEDFDHASLLKWLRESENSYGAMVTFTGVVRDTYNEPLQSLFLEHYPGMTQKALTNIINKTRERWDLERIVVVHRVGELLPNDNIVFIGVVSAHRSSAFEASQFIMDYLKKEAPFWKKEKMLDREEWVAQKQSDLEAAEQWSTFVKDE